MERMFRTFRQLKVFQAAHPRECSLAYLSSTSDSIPELFSTAPPPGKPFLPPSFHVPAIIDALRASPVYQSLVCLVPGEADAYCAQHLSQHGGIVLTSDSDLLAHDLGNGRVVFFREIYLDGSSNLTCSTFSPREISERLGLPSKDLCRFAYERKSCAHSTLPQILQNCARPVKDNVGYERFCQEYLRHEICSLPTSADGGSVPIGFLDPRLSELILQLGLGNSESLEVRENKIFLPVLVEDPLRGSAWEQSLPIRQLAYTLARWLIPGTDSSVQEYRRVNTQVQKGREVFFLTKPNAQAFAEELVAALAQVKEETNNDPILCWQILCLYMDIRESFEQGKKSSVLQVLQQPRNLPRSKTGKIGWEIIHFAAQLQASHYSFRMLKQVTNLFSETEKDSTVSGIRDMLVTFPELSQFPDLEKTIGVLQHANRIQTLKIIARFLDIPDIPSKTAKQQLQPPKDNRQKRPKGGRQVKAASNVMPPAFRNPYDVLSQQ